MINQTKLKDSFFDDVSENPLLRAVNQPEAIELESLSSKWLDMQRAAQGILLSFVCKQGIGYLNAFLEQTDFELNKRHESDLLNIMQQVNLIGLIDELEVIYTLDKADRKFITRREKVLKNKLGQWNPPAWLVANFLLANPHVRSDSVVSKAALDRYSKLREQLINRNLRLVFSVASRFRYLGLSYDDLVQEGNIGLMKAVDYFDANKGFQFSTYAYRVISQFIHLAIEKQADTVRKPFHILRDKKKVDQTRIQLEQALGQPVSSRQIAMHGGFDSASVESLLGRQTMVSADDIVQTHYKPFDDDIVDDSAKALDRSVLTHSASTDDYLSLMPERERNFVRMRFGIGLRKEYTLDEISEFAGLSRERVRQLINKSLSEVNKCLFEQEDDFQTLFDQQTSASI